jgi:hypothetical protein
MRLKVKNQIVLIQLDYNKKKIIKILKIPCTPAKEILYLRVI